MSSNARSTWMLAAVAALVVGCGVGERPAEGAGGRHDSSVGAAQLGVPEPWLAALRDAGITSADRELVHASRTCELVVDGTALHVLDVREIVPSMRSPRGVNHIVLLRGDSRVVRAVRYVDQRPLRCDGNRLLLHGELHVEGDEGTSSGNRLVFSNGGATLHAMMVDIATVPWKNERAVGG